MQATNYLKYTELNSTLNTLCQQYPQFAQLKSIGKSYAGRDIWLVTITNAQSGPAEDKPALWIDGNIHAAELVGSMACLHFIEFLLKNASTNTEIQHCLDTRTFYICPRINPDGAEYALADVPKLVRSSIRPYPLPTIDPNGFDIEDMDGDGRILSMRIPDAHGNWKISTSNSRLMVPRDPAETGGNYYRIMPEGRIRHYDGHRIPAPTKLENLDLNRNFPAQWREEYQQKGAGDYPTSEPEVRAVVDFIVQHKNIASGIAFHSYSGVLLRPFSYKEDSQFAAEDLWVYQTIGEKGTQLTGYPAVSVYHDFQYHPSEVITGALDDWLYENRGIFAWTVEIWSPQREAGINDYKFIDWYRQHPYEDDEKLLNWSDSALLGKGYIDWYPYQHPQLGEVELGGWDCLYSYWNPPAHLLEKELRRFPEWLLWHAQILPELCITHHQVDQLTPGVYKIIVVIQNISWLPSYVTKQSLTKNLTSGVVATLESNLEIQVVQGKLRQYLGELEGRSNKNSSPFAWAGYNADPHDNAVTAEWTIRANNSTTLGVVVSHDKAGTCRLIIELP